MLLIEMGFRGPLGRGMNAVSKSGTIRKLYSKYLPDAIEAKPRNSAYSTYTRGAILLANIEIKEHDNNRKLESALTAINECGDEVND